MRKGQRLPDGFEKNGVAIKFIRPSKVILGTDIDSEIENLPEGISLRIPYSSRINAQIQTGQKRCQS